MLVLHIDTGRQMRGGQHQALYLMRGLTEAGVRSVLLAPEDAPLRQACCETGLPTARLGLASLLRLSRQADVIHAHTGRAHALAAALNCRPLVVSRRVAFPIRSDPLSRWKYRRAARFLAVSQYVKSRLVAAGVSENRISVVYDGVPLLAPSRLEPWLIAPATADPLKGAALVRQAAARAGVTVRFSDNLVRDLSEAGGMVYISREEGLGSGVLLAMSAAVPVVASRVGGLPEAVEHGRTGWLVSNDPDEIAAAMRRLLDDRAAAEEMGRCARRIVEQRFTLEKMVEGTLAVYRSLAP